MCHKQICLKVSSGICAQGKDEEGKRDYLYYLAIGNARIKEYNTALKYIRALLQVAHITFASYTSIHTVHQVMSAQE